MVLSHVHSTNIIIPPNIGVTTVNLKQPLRTEEDCIGSNEGCICVAFVRLNVDF